MLPTMNLQSVRSKGWFYSNYWFFKAVITGPSILILDDSEISSSQSCQDFISSSHDDVVTAETQLSEG